MAKNYQDRREKAPWNSLTTIREFWLRRFFRIAPLYYLLLIVALIFGGLFGECRDIIASAWSSTQTDASRYADRSFINIITHLSFIFGALPEYSFRTVLPDWSIGLEMQFYLLFPFIMLMVMRWGFMLSALVVMVVCLAARFLLADYFDAFPMPSMILIKLPLFVAGMVMAQAVRESSLRVWLVALLAPLCAAWMGIAVTPVRLAAQWVMIIGMTALLWQAAEGSRLQRAMRLPKRLLTLRISQFLGDVSYSVYLLHLMIVIPTIALLVNYSNFEHLPSPVRMLMVAALCTPVVYLCAWGLFHRVEKPGIALGRRIITGRNVRPEQVLP